MPRFPLPLDRSWCACQDHLIDPRTETRCPTCRQLDALPEPCEACLREPAEDGGLCQRCFATAERELRYLIVLGAGLDD